MKRSTIKAPEVCLATPRGVNSEVNLAEHSYHALYYPFIHFKDDRWLKLSALYWDRMGRIVPRTYAREDSDTVRGLGEFIENLHPEWVGPTFGERFAEFVDGYGTKLRDRYAVDRSNSWPVVPAERQPPTAGGATGSDPRLSFVFYEKMSPDVIRRMVTSGIARPDLQDPRWIGMHPRLADVYMTALADQLAGERGLYPLTGETLDHVSVGGRSIERLAQALLDDVELVDRCATDAEIETATMFVALETVMPRDLDALSVEQILAFREKYPAERGRFQQRVASFVKAREWLQGIRDERLLSKRIQFEFEKELKPEFDELREKHRDVGIDTTMGVLTMQVGVPAIAMQAAALAGVALNPIGAAAAGVALAALPILRDRRKVNREVRASEVSYLLMLKQGVRPRQVTNSIVNAAARFRFW